MDELSGEGLLQKLFRETTDKANNVLFLHPQLALCGLVHSVDERELMFGYSHVPSMRNLIQLAAHAYGRVGRPQVVAMMGDWTPTLIQSLVASINDALSEGAPLRWAHPGEVTRLQSALHLYLLFSTLSGKYCMSGLSIQLGAAADHTVQPGLETLWLYPDFLTTLARHNEMEYILSIPVFQHVLSAPREVLEAFLPSSFLGAYGRVEDKAKWYEFVDMFTGLGFADLQHTLEGVLQSLSFTLLLLDTTFEQGNQRMLANIQAMCELLDCNVPVLIQGLRPYLDSKGVVGRSLPEAVYLSVLDWVCECSRGVLKPFKLPKWPFGVENLQRGGVPGGKKPGVSVVLMPQTSPSFGVRGGIPDCLSSCVLLANIASEHLNIWAAKTLLPDVQQVTCCSLVHEFMTPTSEQNPRTYLESCLSPKPIPKTNRKLVKPMPTYTSVTHTHKAINYPLITLEKGTTEKFLLRLAEFLAPLLAADALFTLQVPVYISSNEGKPRLFPGLKDASEAGIENSVFLRAARELYVKSVGGKSPGGKRAVPRKEEVHAQITELQKELEKLDMAEAAEPKERVTYHSTPERKAVSQSSSPSPKKPSPGGPSASPLSGSLSSMVHLTKSFRLRAQRSHTPQPREVPQPQQQTHRRSVSKKPRPPLTTIRGTNNQKTKGGDARYTAVPQQAQHPSTFTQSNWNEMLANM